MDERNKMEKKSTLYMPILNDILVIIFGKKEKLA